MLSLLIGLITASVSVAQQPCQKLSPYVQKQFGLPCASTMPLKTNDEVARASILVVMKDQADLGLKDMYTDPLARRIYIVAALKDTALQSQQGVRQILQAGSYSYTPYFISNLIVVDNADASLVAALAARDDIAKIYGNPSALMKAPLPAVSDFSVFGERPPARGAEANIDAIGATRVWDELNVRGKGIVVAGQDTGVQWDHPALSYQYRGNGPNGVDHNYNWHDSIKTGSGQNSCGYNLSAPCDDDQHGTHTMGTVVGYDGAHNKIGVAPDASWVACRNMDSGMGTPGAYIDCFQFFLAPYPIGGDAFADGNPAKAPNVMNNSWGCPTSEGCKGAEMANLLSNMKEAGIFVVASAGNDGPGCASIADQPANISDFTFSVGAHNHRNETIASFSSRGPSALDGKVGPDVTAPGVAIRSSVPGGNYDGAFWSGTSMAGPHVVGVVALMWSANPKLIGKVDVTSALIRATATPTTTTDVCGGISGARIPNNTYGYGRVNAYAAVKAALAYGK